MCRCALRVAACLTVALGWSVVASDFLNGEVREAAMDVGGTSVQYKVVLPEGFDPGATYPAVLVFGGGPQTMNTVDRTLSQNFRTQAERRGYVVVAPAAPDGDLFFEGGARVIPRFLDAILAEYRIRDGKFHIAGPSNGGIAAFHVAASYPEYFVSVTAFPGYMWQPSAAKLDAISGLCVFMYVGEFDRYMWHDEMEREANYLNARGTRARYLVEDGEPHGIGTLTGDGAGRLFEDFEATASGCRR